MEVIANNRILDLASTQVMGILNVTPDSFFDGGMYCTISKAIDYVASMIDQGATLIDIGGESTRPGFKRISELEESERVLPVLSELVNRFDVCFSINTSSALVIKEGIMIGAHLINDTRSLECNESMKAVAQSKLAICLTHTGSCLNNNNNNNVRQYSDYSSIVSEVDDYFNKQIVRCESEGIRKTRLIIDPGFGFGKSVADNYRLLSNLRYFRHFCLPVLVGISRKSMINYNQYHLPQQKLIGSVTGAVIAAMQGIKIVRSHDVKETVEALQIVQAIRRFK